MAFSDYDPTKIDSDDQTVRRVGQFTMLADNTNVENGEVAPYALTEGEPGVIVSDLERVLESVGKAVGDTDDELDTRLDELARQTISDPRNGSTMRRTVLAAMLSGAAHSTDLRIRMRGAVLSTTAVPAHEHATLTNFFDEVDARAGQDENLAEKALTTLNVAGGLIQYSQPKPSLAVETLMMATVAGAGAHNAAPRILAVTTDLYNLVHQLPIS